jgi:hypothetical protein
VLAEPVAPAKPPTPQEVPDLFPNKPFLDEHGLVEDIGLSAAVASDCLSLAGESARAAASQRNHPAAALAEMLARAPIMRRVQDILWDASVSGEIVPLNRLSHELWAQEGTDARSATERLLRLGARARWQADELPLFPHKLHFLIRSPVAPMAWINPDCGHPSVYRLPGAGPILSASRELCPCCASQTLPLARCGSCGEWFLGATHNSVDNRFRPLRDWREGETNQDEEYNEDEGSGLFLRPVASGATAWEPFQLSDGRRETGGAHVRLTKHDNCTRCGEKIRTRATRRHTGLGPGDRDDACFHAALGRSGSRVETCRRTPLDCIQ